MKTLIILTALLLSTSALADRVKFEKLTPADGPCLYLLDENTGEPTGNAVNPPCTEDGAAAPTQIDPPSLKLDAGPTTEFTVIPSRIEAAKIKVEEGVEGDATAGVIDNAEESAENARETEDGFGNDLDTGNTKAQDYNSSRCNRRGARAANHNSTRSNRGRRLDTDDDDDSVDTKANAVDNDCDDDQEARAPTSSGLKTTTQ